MEGGRRKCGWTIPLDVRVPITEVQNGRQKGEMWEAKFENPILVWNVYLVVEVDLFLEFNVIYCFILRVNCYGRL